MKRYMLAIALLLGANANAMEPENMAAIWCKREGVREHYGNGDYAVCVVNLTDWIIENNIH